MVIFFDFLRMEKFNMKLWIFTLLSMLLFTFFMYPIPLFHIPPYYTALFFINLGLVCWVTNLEILQRTGISIDALLRQRNDSFELRNIYSIIVYLFSLTLVSCYLYKRAELFVDEENAEWIPLFTYLIIVIVLFNPTDFFYYKERMSFQR